MSDKDLNFKPITEGLGFHPFSDGLPYAPTSKSSNSNSISDSFAKGSGAVSAGRPVFVKPRVPSQPVTTASASPVSSSVSSTASSYNRSQTSRLNQISDPSRVPIKHTSLQQHAGAQRSTTVQTPSPASQLSAQLASQLQPTYGFLYLIKRTLAYTLDSTLNMAMCMAILSSVLWDQQISNDVLFSPGIIVLATIFVFAFNWTIICAQEVAFGTSLGKRLFGLTLRGTGTKAFVRAVFFIPSVSFAGLGLFWSLFDRNKRCWHDRAADLQPDEIARL